MGTKKCIFIILLCISFSSNITGQKRNDDFFLEKGLELTMRNVELLNCKEYDKLLYENNELKDIKNTLSSLNFEKPDKVFIITNIKNIYQIPPNASIELEEWLSNISLIYIPTRINQKYGSVTLAVLSSYTMDDYFFYKGLRESTAYLYRYKGNYQSIAFCYYVNKKENIIRMYAQFVKISPQNYNLNTTDNVIKFFRNELKMAHVSVKQISIKK